MPFQPKRILFLIPYPLNESPSQRFRFEQYFQLLSNQGFKFETQSFLHSRNWKLFFEPGNVTLKFLALTSGFVRRIVLLFKMFRYDYVFIHREAAPIGPPVIEWVIGRLLNKKVIYDFDDAIWLTDRTTESALMRILKWRGKIQLVCQWSYKISCGNEYLAHFARQFNKTVVVNPTTIDTAAVHNPSLYHNSETRKHGIVIGWTGSHSTLKYLDDLVDVFREIEQKYHDIRVTVIADRKPDLNLRSLHFVPWGAETEIVDLLQFDIGIMPLPDDKWAKGKCGFKALQYMALRIPAIASRVGVNNEIIDHGQNGFLCTTHEDWIVALTTLIDDKSLREKMGANGRDKIINSYSVASNSALFLKLFE